MLLIFDMCSDYMVPNMESLLEQEVATPETTEEPQGSPEMSAEDFNRVYSEHSAKVFHFILSKQIPYHDALEVSQEVFILIYTRFHQLKDIGKLQSWIMEITFQSIQTYYRRKKHQTISFSAFNTPETAERLIVPDPRGNHPFLQAIQQESALLLHQQIKKLSVFDRDVIRSCELEGDTMYEAANRLNIPEGTVKRRLFDARRRLRGKMMKVCTAEDFF